MHVESIAIIDSSQTNLPLLSKFICTYINYYIDVIIDRNFKYLNNYVMDGCLSDVIIYILHRVI